MGRLCALMLGAGFVLTRGGDLQERTVVVRGGKGPLGAMQTMLGLFGLCPDGWMDLSASLLHASCIFRCMNLV